VPIYLGNLVIGYLFFGHEFTYGSYEEGWRIIEEKCSDYRIKISELKSASLKQSLMTEGYILSMKSQGKVMAWVLPKSYA